MSSIQETPWKATSNYDFIWNSNFWYQKELIKVYHCYKIQTLLIHSKAYETPKFLYKKILILPSMIFQKCQPAINKGGLHYVKSIALFISFNFLFIVGWSWSFFSTQNDWSHTVPAMFIFLDIWIVLFQPFLWKYCS